MNTKENVTERRVLDKTTKHIRTTVSSDNPMSEAHRIIRDAILDEAEEKISKYASSGHLIKTKIQEISEEMELEPDEVEELTKRFDEDIRYPVIPDVPNNQNIIWFDTEDDLNQVIGMLMYKGVAWSSKGGQDGRYFVEFPNKETLLKANDVIKRRWDLVDSDQRTVGFIQFDNLKDYIKVMDFIMKSNMMVTFGSSIASMGEDYDIEYSAGSKKPKEANISTREGSYLAKNKKTQLDKDPDPINNPEDRIASVRKIWK